MAKAPAKKTNPNSLAEKVAKLSIIAKAGVFLGSAVLAGAVFYMLVYTPYSEDRDTLQSAISSLKQNLTTEKATLQKHQAVDKLKESIDWSYAYMQQYLPQEHEMSRLVQMVSEIGAKAGLTDGVTLFAPKLPGKVQPNYVEIPFSMKLQGEFATVLSFIYDFSRMNRIVNITEVKIGSPQMIDEKREILQITVDCNGSTYRSLTDAEVAAQSAPKGKGRGRG
ncbi:hypothetical protein FACS189460_3520 [Deltaproteobacteria bacterium]|nr:hypothetical protein FACS189460_3520 [Deltaproteobacteria bacterium]